MVDLWSVKSQASKIRTLDSLINSVPSLVGANFMGKTSMTRANKWPLPTTLTNNPTHGLSGLGPPSLERSGELLHRCGIKEVLP